MVDKDRIKGKVKQAAGSVEEKAGEVTGNPDTEMRGAERKREGQGQELWGNAKDTARDAKDKLKP